MVADRRVQLLRVVAVGEVLRIDPLPVSVPCCRRRLTCRAYAAQASGSSVRGIARSILRSSAFAVAFACSCVVGKLLASFTLDSSRAWLHRRRMRICLREQEPVIPGRWGAKRDLRT